MLVFVRATLLLGLRNRSAPIVLLLALIVALLALMGANFSGRSPDTLALDLGLSVQRMVLTVLGVYWAQEMVARDFERKTIITQLAYPQPRHYYLIGRYCGLACMLLLATMAMSSALHVAVRFNPMEYRQVTPVNLGLAYWVTCLFQYVDLLVVLAFTIMVSCLSTTSFLPLLCGLTFAIIGRSVGPTLDLLEMPTSFMQHETGFSGFLSVVRYLVPNLDVLDVRSWPMYSLQPPSGLGWGLLMAASYILICISVAVNRMHYRQVD